MGVSLIPVRLLRRRVEVPLEQALSITKRHQASSAPLVRATAAATWGSKHGSFFFGRALDGVMLLGTCHRAAHN